eukprot:gene29517-36583_t
MPLEIVLDTPDGEFNKDLLGGEMNSLEWDIKQHIRDERRKAPFSAEGRRYRDLDPDSSSGDEDDTTFNKTTRGRGVNRHKRGGYANLDTASTSSKPPPRNTLFGISTSSTSSSHPYTTDVQQGSGKNSGHDKQVEAMLTSDKLQIELTKLDKRLTAELMRRQRAKANIQRFRLDVRGSILKNRLPTFRKVLKSENGLETPIEQSSNLSESERSQNSTDGFESPTGRSGHKRATFMDSAVLNVETMNSSVMSAMTKSPNNKSPSSQFMRKNASFHSSVLLTSPTHSTIRSPSHSTTSPSHKPVQLIISETMVTLKERRDTFEAAMSNQATPATIARHELYLETQALKAQEQKDLQFNRFIYGASESLENPQQNETLNNSHSQSHFTPQPPSSTSSRRPSYAQPLHHTQSATSLKNSTNNSSAHTLHADSMDATPLATAPHTAPTITVPQLESAPPPMKPVFDDDVTTATQVKKQPQLPVVAAPQPVRTNDSRRNSKMASDDETQFDTFHVAHTQPQVSSHSNTHHVHSSHTSHNNTRSNSLTNQIPTIAEIKQHKKPSVPVQPRPPSHSATRPQSQPNSSSSRPSPHKQKQSLEVVQPVDLQQLQQQSIAIHTAA